MGKMVVDTTNFEGGLRAWGFLFARLYELADDPQRFSSLLQAVNDVRKVLRGKKKLEGEENCPPWF